MLKYVVRINFRFQLLQPTYARWTIAHNGVLPWRCIVQINVRVVDAEILGFVLYGVHQIARQGVYLLIM